MVSERLVLDAVIPWPCPCWVLGYRKSAEPGIKLELWLWAMSHDIEHNHGANDDSEVCLLLIESLRDILKSYISCCICRGMPLRRARVSDLTDGPAKGSSSIPIPARGRGRARGQEQGRRGQVRDTSSV